MKLYQPYLDQLHKVIDLALPTEQRNVPSINGLPERAMLKSINEGLLSLDTQHNSLHDVAKMFGIQTDRRPKLAPHPDFAHLKHSELMTEEHYIVSLFLDVKGSTTLFKRLTKEQVHGIVNIVNRAATHTLTLFGGYTQRIMFDGVFFYFGGKNIPYKQAVMDAINGATMFCYFMENELPGIFDAYGLEKVTARVGIDFGDADDVLWGLHGTIDCGELSTTSLHTSLAAKMQSEAFPNGIVIGKHMRERIANRAFPFCKAHEKPYIFQSKDFNYSQYHFNWAAYLKTAMNDTAELKPNGMRSIDAAQVIFGQAIARNEQMEHLGAQLRLMEAGTDAAFIAPSGQIISKPTSIPVPKNSSYSDDK